MSIPHLTVPHPAGDGRSSWTPSPLVLTPNNTLQGGAGLGAAVSAMEAATGRRVVWATAQYLTYAAGTAPIDVDVTIEVSGRNTTQARAVLSRDGREILTAHAAFGHRDFPVEDVWTSRPAVPKPADCERYRFFELGQGHMGDLIEMRLASGSQLDEVMGHGRRGSGSFALWARCWDGVQQVTASDLAFVGDMMPLGFAQAIGGGYSGNSLDNTIRVGRLVPTEWMLLSIQVQQVINGFGHGHGELWAEDGTLLGAVSQSVVVRPFSGFKRQHTPAAT